MIRRFFARPLPPQPQEWPSVSLIQPVTRGATSLSANLAARFTQDYPGVLEHIVVCDAADAESQEVCRAALPSAIFRSIPPDIPDSVVATKVGKMTAGAEAATGDVIIFVDDDIGLPPDAIRVLVRYLLAPGAGAGFGLACQRSWENGPSSLLSAFVNANALTGYVPLAECIEPYTVTGHWFGMTRETFTSVGGMDGFAGRFDDDHEFARRVRKAGKRIVQTPVIYDVSNHLPTWRAYLKQMRRWFVIPKQGMLPHLTPRENAWTTLLSVGNLLPTIAVLLALFAPSPMTVASVAVIFALFVITYFYLEARYLPRRTPLYRLVLLPAVAFLIPAQILAQLLIPGEVIEWRGQKMRVLRGGGTEILPK
jgi:ceramide glucosyltransferase